MKSNLISRCTSRTTSAPACPADQARRAAILKSGGIEPAKEAYRDRRTVPVLENLLRDTRYAVRQLRQNPGFTATAVVVLALGLCASVAIFAFVDGALIKPLPYRDPARLVGVFETNAANLHANLSYLDYLDWKAQNRAFRSLEAYAHGGVGLTLATPQRQPARGRCARERRLLPDVGASLLCWAAISTQAKICPPHRALSCSATPPGERDTAAIPAYWARRSRSMVIRTPSSGCCRRIFILRPPSPRSFGPRCTLLPVAI
jgi:hypothetical protein